MHVGCKWAETCINLRAYSIYDWTGIMLTAVFSTLLWEEVLQIPLSLVFQHVLRRAILLRGQSTLVSSFLYILIIKVNLFHAGECYCGNGLVNGATTAPEADCNMGCSGKTTCVVFIPFDPPLPDFLFSEACGGPNRLSVYSNGPITPLPVPGPRTTGLPGQWEYKGCLRLVQLCETLNLVCHTFLANLQPPRCSHTKLSGQPITLPWRASPNVVLSVSLRQVSR